MSLRPVQARWFELLTAREHLHMAVEALARTGSVELEMHSDERAHVDLPDMQVQLEEYNRLARRYHPYWPQAELPATSEPGKPTEIIGWALDALHAWEQDAAPLIQRLESLTSERHELGLLGELLAGGQFGELDFALLTQSGGEVAARIFVLPAKQHLEQLPAAVLHRRVLVAPRQYLVAVGTLADLAQLASEIAVHKGREVHVPAWLSGNQAEVRKQIHLHLEAAGQQTGRIQEQIDLVSARHALPQALGDINRLEWLITHIHSFPATENFAWVTGWTSDVGGASLNRALADPKINAIVHFPHAPEQSTPPMIMQNPWWAQPFELFARMLGVPDQNEADPSRLLAVIAPLLFGYMFGDVGQGLVLLLTGALLQRRWPVLRLLIANGAAAIVFGFVFGSVFGREDIIPALWVHPVEQPLPVLGLPLLGGVLLLLLGLLLNAVEAHWRGTMRHWFAVDAAILVMYLAILATYFAPVAAYLAAAGLAWYLAGSVWLASPRHWSTPLLALGELVESMLQLLINTISFVRVGAFALAHAGLSLAFNILAEAADHVVLSLFMLLLGNLIVILLEGLVVTIQTTRLILFEFFIRFLRGSGRIFKPLPAPGNPLDKQGATPS